MGCGVVERHLKMAQPTKKTIEFIKPPKLSTIMIIFQHTKHTLGSSTEGTTVERNE